MWTRRQLLAAMPAAGLVGCGPPPSPWVGHEQKLAGGRIGVFALDAATGKTLAWRADERFALCSTFKWLLAAFVVKDTFDGRVYVRPPHLSITADDLVPYAPVVTHALNASRSEMTVDELCGAVVGLSDNAAANILLRTIGGPSGFTERCRAIGDSVTRLDRWEVALNENAPGDPRDTTTADAMTRTLHRVLFTDALLNADDRARVADWMIGAQTGLKRLRGGIPDGMVAGDKTGTSLNGAFNDVAFVIPAGRTAPVLISSFIDAADVTGETADHVHRAVAREVITRLGIS